MTTGTAAVQVNVQMFWSTASIEHWGGWMDGQTDVHLHPASTETLHEEKPFS